MERLENSGRLVDVTGAGVLDPETQRAMKADFEQMNRGAVTRSGDERP